MDAKENFQEVAQAAHQQHAREAQWMGIAQAVHAARPCAICAAVAVLDRLVEIQPGRN